MTDTNYKALCAELADALLCWQTDGAWIDQAEQSRLIARARAALAQQPVSQPYKLPEPAAPPMPVPGDAEGLAEVFWNRYDRPEPVAPKAMQILALGTPTNTTGGTH